jgi:hypothetical protein
MTVAVAIFTAVGHIAFRMGKECGCEMQCGVEGPRMAAAVALRSEAVNHDAIIEIEEAASLRG